MKNRKTFLSVIACCVLAAAFVFAAAACDFRTDEGSASPDFSGNNSDYVIDKDYGDSEAEGANLAAAYEATYRSVVTVSVSLSDGQTQTGSGFIVDFSAGYVVTSSSLFASVSNNAMVQNCNVALHDGTDIPARLQGYDALSMAGLNLYAEADMLDSRFIAGAANSDIALLKLDNVQSGVYSVSGTEISLPSAVAFSDSDALVYGEECFSIATLAHEEDVLPGLMNEGIVTKPFNTHESAFYMYEQPAFGNSGRVTPFFDNSFDYLIQTGVPVNAGNEGAPLFNADGEVIGMVNMRVNDTYVYSENAPFGITFATPSETVYEVLGEAGVAVSYEQNNAVRESCIVNADELPFYQARDSVAQMLMEESSDYLVINENADIVFRKQGEESSEGIAPQYIAENNLDRTVKVIAYSQVETSQILSEGSGLLIDKDGYILTNLHVINALSEQNQSESGLANSSVQLANSVYCVFERGTANGRFVVMPMDIIAYHQRGDLAILKFKNAVYHETAAGSASRAAGFESACVLESAVPKAGASVAALGNALGYGVSVSAGVVSIPEFTSYYSIYGYNMIQTDCPINSGNSGGALFDANGKVVGINTLGFGGEGYDNVSWAIPAAFAVQFVGEVNQGNTSGYVHITEAGAGASIALES